MLGNEVLKDTVNVDHYYDSLEKHTYPSGVKALFFLCSFLFLFVMPHFLWVDLPYCYKIHAQIVQADDFFLHEDYIHAAQLYVVILQEHPSAQEIKKKLAKTCFALTAQNHDYYLMGLRYLSGEKYYDDEIKSMEKLLPKEYREDFKLHFKKVK